MKVLGIIISVLAISLLSRSCWVWSQCGYDCGIFGLHSGPAAIAGFYLGGLVLVLTAVFATVVVWWRWFRRKKKKSPSRI